MFTTEERIRRLRHSPAVAPINEGNAHLWDAAQASGITPRRLSYAGATISPEWSDVSRGALNRRLEQGPIINQPFGNNAGSVQFDFLNQGNQNGGPPIVSSFLSNQAAGTAGHAERMAFRDALESAVERSLAFNDFNHPTLNRLQAAEHAFPIENIPDLSALPNDNPALRAYRNAFVDPEFRATIFSERSPCYNNPQGEPSCLEFFPKVLNNVNTQFGYIGNEPDDIRRQGIAATEIMNAPIFNPANPNFDQYANIVGRPAHGNQGAIQANPALLAAYPWLNI